MNEIPPASDPAQVVEAGSDETSGADGETVVRSWSACLILRGSTGWD